jgi:hypothetical protein
LARDGLGELGAATVHPGKKSLKRIQAEIALDYQLYILDVKIHGGDPRYAQYHTLAGDPSLYEIRAELAAELTEEEVNELSRKFAVWTMGIPLIGPGLRGMAAAGRGLAGAGRKLPGAAAKLREYIKSGLLDNAAPATRGVVAPSNSPVPRLGPRGVDPAHHNANIMVRDASGRLRHHERIVSGNMTPEEQALGFPRNTLASHTEARAIRNIPLQRGETMTITGQRPPCPTCKGVMNQAARESGATIIYRWRENGVTRTWTAGN